MRSKISQSRREVMRKVWLQAVKGLSSLASPQFPQQQVTGVIFTPPPGRHDSLPLPAPSHTPGWILEAQDAQEHNLVTPASAQIPTTQTGPNIYNLVLQLKWVKSSSQKTKKWNPWPELNFILHFILNYIVQIPFNNVQLNPVNTQM